MTEIYDRKIRSTLLACVYSFIGCIQCLNYTHYLYLFIYNQLQMAGI